MSVILSINNKLVPLGTPTKWGRVVGVTARPERAYFIMGKDTTVILIPGDILEAEYTVVNLTKEGL